MDCFNNNLIINIKGEMCLALILILVGENQIDAGNDTYLAWSCWLKH